MMGYFLEFCYIFPTAHINNRPCATTRLIILGYVQYLEKHKLALCVSSHLGKFIAKEAV